MHTHHSHSGDYISHAKDHLESMIAKYIEMGFKSVCLTEHMPRLSNNFLYPEELDKSYTIENLQKDFLSYIDHAERVQKLHHSSLPILLGFEIEGINEEHIKHSLQLIKHPKIQMSVGSVHFVHEIPIDFSSDLWMQAKSKSGKGLTRSLYKDYFDLQSRVLDLEPNVVGHFDLIRLCQPADDFDETTNKLTIEVDIEKDWPEVWQVISNNIMKIVKYGGLFELNSSAIRKGWKSPYPQWDIAKRIVDLNGKFCLSDDAHACSQIGFGYDKVLQYAKDLGLTKLYHLEACDGAIKCVPETIETIEKTTFWKQFS
ncbi:hypothetical protein KGF56_000741 [Candida oxycetoniae]|uniref:Histidinol-phosphatase n=1 Tax=Candida oxycetoniae TaxID=497107 RepID=A0AAI9X006_9ASCO|nr:uncharacterized protein KGF56_000741 [Candida oxycetoniae]KAI3406609.1 hypothetical protein KGF56_000741 [Candida oxycetoniae]